MQRALLLFFINFTVPKNSQRDTHKTRKPLSSTGNNKTQFLKINFFSKSFFFGKKTRSAENRALGSQNEFFKLKTFMKVKEIHFDHTKNISQEKSDIVC